MNLIHRFLLERKIKKSGLKLTREDLLRSRPVRNSLVKWNESENGEVSLIVPQKKTLWVRILSAISMLPRSRVVALDELGSLVWTMCDGHNSIDSIVKTLRHKYKLTRKEVDASLLAYFRKLGKRGIIAFAVPKAKAPSEQEMERNISILPDQKSN